MKMKFYKYPLEKEKAWKKYGCQPFNISLPHVVYSKTGTKILIVVDRVPTEDIISKTLFSGETGHVVKNVTEHLVKNIGGLRECKFINLHCFRINKLSDTAQQEALQDFFDRVMKCADEYDPNIIMFCGEESYKIAFKSNKIMKYFGIINKFEYNGKTYKGLVTLGPMVFGTSERKNYKEYPNLIGIYYRHLETAIHGKNRYVIKKNVNKTEKILVDTMEKFNKFFKRLCKSEVVCLDYEGTSLNRINNKLLTSQWFLDYDKKAYFLPLFHTDSSFTQVELEQILEKLRWYFEHGTSKYIVAQNAKFELIQTLSQIKSRFINHKVYDIMAGEFALEENLKFLYSYAKKTFYPYALESIEYKYGYDREFSESKIKKEDRGNMENFSIEDIFEYGLLDVITIYYIHLCQRMEAKRRGSDYNGFLNCVTEVISDMIHCFAEMEFNGIPIDKKYLFKMKMKNSLFSKQLDEINEKYKDSKAAQKVNKLLLEEKGLTSNSLFKKASNWVFNINEVKSQQYLFFKVLKLEIPEKRADGGGKVNNFFKKKFKEIKEVALIETHGKIKKLKSTYIDGIFKQLVSDPDALLDGRLRPNFGFITVVTGRASAEKPGFQQIPSRGDLSKPIKRQFIAECFYILVEADAKAHEINCWGIISNDNILTQTFRTGINSLRKLRLAKKSKYKEYKKIYEDSGDPHRLNYKFFFGRFPANKDERNSVKSVVFGSLYGKSANSLAKDIKDTIDKAKMILKKMFSTFKSGGEWLKNTITKARSTFRAVSPLGRVRHFWAYMHHDESVHAAMDRRGPNSMIQGMASDFGFIGGREMKKLIWNLLVSQNINFTYQHFLSVHDSNKGMVHIVELPLQLYIQEHASTTMVHRKVRKVFKFNICSDIQIEFEIGGAQSNLFKWDYLTYSTEKDNENCDNPGDMGIGLMEIVEKSIDWMIKELDYKELIEAKDLLLECVEHNQKIINKYRRKELKKNLKSNKTSEIMLLTKDKIKEENFIFADDFHKLLENRKSGSISEKLAA